MGHSFATIYGRLKSLLICLSGSAWWNLSAHLTLQCTFFVCPGYFAIQIMVTAFAKDSKQVWNSWRIVAKTFSRTPKRIFWNRRFFVTFLNILVLDRRIKPWLDFEDYGIMETQNPSREALVQLVQKCLNEHGETEGFIERQQFVSFCADLSVSVDELDNVFNELDGDHDGRINASDFTSGFDLVSCFINKEEPELQNFANGCVDKSLYECQVDGVGSPMQIIGG